MQILFVHGTMDRVCAPEVPPLGAGFNTVMLRVPVDVMSLPKMLAVRVVELTNVVVRLTPSRRTTEFETKFVPLTVSVNGPLPTVTVAGAMDVVVGAGLLK